MPVESDVIKVFPSLFKRLIEFIQLKTLTQRSEIRLGIVIKPTTDSDLTKMQEGIASIKQACLEAELKAKDRADGPVYDFDLTSIS